MRTFAAAFATTAVLACGGGPRPPTPPGLLPPPCELASEAYLIDEVTFPRSQADVDAQAFDLDGMYCDGCPARPDNRLGAVLHVLLSDGAPLDSAMADALLSDRIRWVLLVSRCADSSYRRVSLHHATVVDRSRGVARVRLTEDGGYAAVGSINDAGTIVATEGKAPAPLASFFDVAAAEEEPVWLEGAALAVEVCPDAGDTVSLRAGIAIPSDVARASLVDALSRSFGAIVAADVGCPMACSTEAAAYLLALFDADGDGAITGAEVEAADATDTLLAPDVDMLALDEGQAVFWPGHDDVADSLSLGIAMHATRAIIEP